MKKTYMESWLEHGMPEKPLLDEIARLRKALEFYAFTRQWDRGYTATQALAGKDLNYLTNESHDAPREL